MKCIAKTIMFILGILGLARLSYLIINYLYDNHTSKNSIYNEDCYTDYTTEEADFI